MGGGIIAERVYIWGFVGMLCTGRRYGEEFGIVTSFGGGEVVSRCAFEWGDLFNGY